MRGPYSITTLSMLPTITVRASSPADMFSQFRRATVEPLRAWFHLPLVAVSLETPLDGVRVGPALPVSRYDETHPTTVTKVAKRLAREARDCIAEDLMKPGETFATSLTTSDIDPFEAYLDRRIQVTVTRDESQTFWIILHVMHVAPNHLVDIIDELTTELSCFADLPRLHVVGTMQTRGRYPLCPV